MTAIQKKMVVVVVMMVMTTTTTMMMMMMMMMMMVMMMMMITTWSASRMIHFIYTCTPSGKKLQIIKKKKVKKWMLWRGNTKCMFMVNCTLN